MPGVSDHGGVSGLLRVCGETHETDSVFPGKDLTRTSHHYTTLQGHIICDDCLAALQASDNRNKDCVLCQMKYVGRPTVLEKLLGLTL